MPAATMLQRDFSTRLAVPDTEGDGRTITGLAVPFDVEITVRDFWDDYSEVFRKGSFAKTIRENPHPQLLAHHDSRAMPLGVASELHEEDDGLYGTWRLSATSDGNDAATLIADGAIGGLSVGFVPITNRKTDAPDRAAKLALVERLEVRLMEVSLCNFPAFADAGVTGQRTQRGQRPKLADLAARRDITPTGVDRFGRIAR